MFKLMGKKIITILRKLFLLNWPYDISDDKSYVDNELLDSFDDGNDDLLASMDIEQEAVCPSVEENKDPTIQGNNSALFDLIVYVPSTIFH